MAAAKPANETAAKPTAPAKSKGKKEEARKPVEREINGVKVLTR